MGKKKTSKMGRPRFPAGKAKSIQIAVRIEPVLYEKMQAAARREGKGVATWLRDTVARLLGSK
jgi:predicted HicB family RNase H-like nuclease